MMQQKTAAAVAIVNFVIKSVHDFREKCVFNDFLEKNNKARALRVVEKGKTQENLQIWKSQLRPEQLIAIKLDAA
jgi:hypothetical protein